VGTTGLVDQTPLTFIPEPRETSELEIRVNFGMFANRDATNAEIDDLARDLLGVLRRVSIVSLRRHEVDGDVEAAIHQVKVEASSTDAREPSDDLEATLLELVDAWARRAIEHRHVELAEVEAQPEPAG
jgi:hypothetical protein